MAFAQPTSGERVCPFCAETIKAAAVVCRFCGRDQLPAAAAAAANIAESERPAKGLVACRSCGSGIGPDARTCPKCGARVPRTKWWLWVPLGLAGAFLAYGFSIPEYKSRALELRRVCEQLAAPHARYECDRIYARAIAEGERKQSKQSERELVPQSAIVTVAPAPWEKPGNIADRRKQLASCWADSKVRKVDAAKCEELDYEFRQKFNVAP